MNFTIVNHTKLKDFGLKNDNTLTGREADTCPVDLKTFEKAPT